MREVVLEVRRRCLVCDAEVTVTERENTDQIGGPCPECQAPTERIQVLARHHRTVEANPYAAALGRLGGLRGGPARAAALSRERRRDIARLAARRRWSRPR
jgi:hypothetical protein